MSKAPIGRRAASAVDAHVGQKIRARRIFLQMSQTEFSEALGITFQQVQKYEKGQSRPTAARLQQISEALGVSPFYFFEGRPPAGKKAPAPEKESMSEASMEPRAPRAVDAYVGQRIRLRRMTLGMSQTQLGDALGITAEQVQGYEKGTECVGGPGLDKIGNALGVPFLYFVGDASTVENKTSAPEKEFVSEASIDPRASSVIDAYIGKRIRTRRMMLGMSQWLLGDALGITVEQVQEYEKGAEHIGVSQLQKISTALSVSPSYFLEGAPTVSERSPD
jgi:transcriptional regulator with XRE-family HTH domain